MSEANRIPLGRYYTQEDNTCVHVQVNCGKRRGRNRETNREGQRRPDRGKKEQGEEVLDEGTEPAVSNCLEQQLKVGIGLSLNG